MDTPVPAAASRQVVTTPPSFPQAPAGLPLQPQPGLGWQVLCGDREHWRLGWASPAATCYGPEDELEQHDCPELFLLLSGRMHLVVVENGALRTLELEPGRPVLITAPHFGYCPDGPHRCAVLVVERDRFVTEYRKAEGWLSPAR